MPETYTLNLGITKPATGEMAGVWGNVANANYDWIDTACDGNLEIELAAPSYTLSTNQGADSEGRNKVITFTGALTGSATVNILPKTAEKLYFFRNYTGGGHPIIFQQGAGPAFTLKNGYSAIVYADGLGNTASVRGVIDDLQVTSVIATRLTVTETVTIQAPVTYTQPVTFATTTAFQQMATFTGGLTLNLGGDAANDILFRSAAGPLARLGIGTAGQVLIANPGPQWSHSLPASLTFAAQATFSGGLVATGAVLHGPVTIELAGSAAGDTYLRTAGGPLARLPIGTANMVMIVSSGAPAWSDTLTGVWLTSCALQGSTTLNVGGDAANDMYYRSAGGPLARIPTGSGLLAMGATPGWATTIGASITFSALAAFSGGASLAHPIYFAVPGGQAHEMYYRHTDGWLASIAPGAAGQFLQRTGGGYQWATVSTSIGIGTPIVGAAGNLVFYADGAGNLAQHGHFIWTGAGLGLGISPGRTLHVGGAMAPQIWLDGAATGSQRHLAFASSSVGRWLLLASSEAESGGNVGSNLVWQRYADNGTIISNIFALFRNTGHTTVGGYADLGGQLNVWNQVAAEPATVVRGAASQTADLQQWQNSAGSVLAKIDASGNLSVAGGPVLQPSANGGYDIYGSVTGHPIGTLHIGPGGGSPGGTRPCVVLEYSSGTALSLAGLAAVRFYVTNTVPPKFCIQYASGAQNYWAVMPLNAAAGAAAWTITTSPQ
jgi:hypothetical protein